MSACLPLLTISRPRAHRCYRGGGWNESFLLGLGISRAHLYKHHHQSPAVSRSEAGGRKTLKVAVSAPKTYRQGVKVPDEAIVQGEKRIGRALTKAAAASAGHFCSPELQSPFHLMQHPRPPQGQAALGSGFSTTLQDSRNCKDAALMTVKDHKLQTYGRHLFFLINCLHISGIKMGCFLNFLNYFFSPGKKGWPPALGRKPESPQDGATSPVSIIPSWRSGQRKRCPHVADESMVSPV